MPFCLFIGKQGQRDVWAQRHMDTLAQEHRDTGTQGHKDKGAQGHRVLGIQGHMDIGIYEVGTYKNNSTQRQNFGRILDNNHYIQRDIWAWGDGDTGTYEHNVIG